MQPPQKKAAVACETVLVKIIILPKFILMICLEEEVRDASSDSGVNGACRNVLPLNKRGADLPIAILDQSTSALRRGKDDLDDIDPGKYSEKERWW